MPPSIRHADVYETGAPEVMHGTSMLQHGSDTRDQFRNPHEAPACVAESVGATAGYRSPTLRHGDAGNARFVKLNGLSDGICMVGPCRTTSRSPTLCSSGTDGDECGRLELAMTENTTTLLRLLAYQGGVEVDAVADRARVPVDEIRAATVEGLFEVWALEGGNGEPVTLKRTPDGYYTARRLLRSESPAPAVS